MSNEPDTCKFDGEHCTYCGWVCAKNTRQTYCMKHYRRTFPDMGCDMCKLERLVAGYRMQITSMITAHRERLAELESENSWLREACKFANEQESQLSAQYATILKLETEKANLLEALTPSMETKAEYWGNDGWPELNWTDIKMLMRLILDRAGV